MENVEGTIHWREWARGVYPRPSVDRTIRLVCGYWNCSMFRNLNKLSKQSKPVGVVIV